MKTKSLSSDTVAIIGLGYVGLPLAISFSKHLTVIGFDLNNNRVNELKNGIDVTREIEKIDLISNKNIIFTDNPKDISNANIYIITVPTPVLESKDPDFSPLESACHLVGKHLRTRDIVIFESTVYPGATEEVCIPILEKISGLIFNQEFFVGYSPERINPGDKKHTLDKIVKIVSGSNTETLNRVDDLYKKIIDAGTYRAPSIKIAEAAKVIENTQRDVNIGLINELSMLFDKLDISTNEVLKASSTKWNFHNYKPGLVGGHCIGVDPYYLTYKARSVGHHPEIILSGRRTNDSMPNYWAQKFVLKLVENKNQVVNNNCLVLGLTFKENCPDTRNSGVFPLIDRLKHFGIEIKVCDPWISNKERKNYKNLDFIDSESLISLHFDSVILATGHDTFKDLDHKLRQVNQDIVIFDPKNFFRD